MSKIKICLAEKKLLRRAIALALIQVVIVLFFADILIRQIDENEIKHSDIVVDDVYKYRSFRTETLMVVADSKHYLFSSRPTLKEASVNDIYESISIGDQLSLTYYEAQNMVFGKFNVVVDARSETEIYRTLEEYNRSIEGALVGVVILCLIIEMIFCVLVLGYIWINFGMFKSIYRKIKKHHSNKKAHKT
jgi:hypothetical protein